METIRLGMVGFGFRGRGLWGMVRSVEGLAPTAICDADPGAAAHAKETCPDVAFYDDYEAMLDSGRIDAVLVETPPAMHADCSIKALERDIHVLSDVPLIHDPGEAEPLWRAGERSKALLMFGSTTNFFGHVDAITDLLDKGLIGKPFYMEADYIQDLTEFSKMTPWREGYEPIRYCTHSLGPALKWLGQELEGVSCLDTGSHVHGLETEHDAMVAIFNAAGGAVVKLAISFVNAHPHGFHRHACLGTEGCFECVWPLTGADPKVRFSTRNLRGVSRFIELPVSSTRPELATLENISGHGPADFAMLTDFVSACRTGHCELDLRAALRMTLPGLYALASARMGVASCSVAGRNWAAATSA